MVSHVFSTEAWHSAGACAAAGLDAEGAQRCGGSSAPGRGARRALEVVRPREMVVQWQLLFFCDLLGFIRDLSGFNVVYWDA